MNESRSRALRDLSTPRECDAPVPSHSPPGRSLPPALPRTLRAWTGARPFRLSRRASRRDFRLLVRPTAPHFTSASSEHRRASVSSASPAAPSTRAGKCLCGNRPPRTPQREHAACLGAEERLALSPTAPPPAAALPPRFPRPRRALGELRLGERRRSFLFLPRGTPIAPADSQMSRAASAAATRRCVECLLRRTSRAKRYPTSTSSSLSAPLGKMQRPPFTFARERLLGPRFRSLKMRRDPLFARARSSSLPSPHTHPASSRLSQNLRFLSRLLHPSSVWGGHSLFCGAPTLICLAYCGVGTPTPPNQARLFPAWRPTQGLTVRRGGRSRCRPRMHRGVP